jgi:hypothetical protein
MSTRSTAALISLLLACSACLRVVDDDHGTARDVDLGDLAPGLDALDDLASGPDSLDDLDDLLGGPDAVVDAGADLAPDLTPGLDADAAPEPDLATADTDATALFGDLGDDEPVPPGIPWDELLGDGIPGDHGGAVAPVYPFAREQVVTATPDGHRTRASHRNWDLDCAFGDAVGSLISGQVVSVRDGAPRGTRDYGNSVCVHSPSLGVRVCHNHLEAGTIPEAVLAFADCSVWVEAGERIGGCGNSGYVIPLEGGDGTHLDTYALDDAGQNVELPHPDSWTRNPSLAEPDLPAACEPPCVDACGPRGGAECVGGTALRSCGDYDGDGCVEWSAATSCGAGGCSGGACVSCTPDTTRRCSGGDVYAYDSCGARGSLIDACASNETCQASGSTASCVRDEPTCTPDTTRRCSGGDVYAYDSCGARGSLVDACASNETCQASGGTASCVRDEPTCPSGDGRYCGGAAGLDPNTLYECRGGSYSFAAHCAAGCQVNPPGTHDACRAGSCPSGNGRYCGQTVGRSASELLQCTNGVYTPYATCSRMCTIAPPGEHDYCP